jgi:glycerol-3-phosphate dehydrogenase (NAD(P)+)
MKQIAIIGGGGWGTALAILLARNQHPLRLWTYEEDLAREINRTRMNPLFLPGQAIPENVIASPSLAEVLEGAELVLSAVPSQHCRHIYTQMLPHLKPAMVFVTATKGLEHGSHLRMSEVMAEILASQFEPKIAVISGPSFALEAARGDPTAIVVASRNKEIAQLVQQEFSGPTFRLYTNSDVAGVELGGAVKNVIAISAGICHGLGFGFNTVAALITRGLAEMTRLAVACGGKKETLAGLAGMGDLLLTSTGGLSRNRSVGVQIGQGKKLSDIIPNMRMVAEGVTTTHATLDLAARQAVEMPIVGQMDLVLNQDKNPREAIRDLMDRRLRDE